MDGGTGGADGGTGDGSSGPSTNSGFGGVGTDGGVASPSADGSSGLGGFTDSGGLSSFMDSSDALSWSPTAEGYSEGLAPISDDESNPIARIVIQGKRSPFAQQAIGYALSKAGLGPAMTAINMARRGASAISDMSDGNFSDGVAKALRSNPLALSLESTMSLAKNAIQSIFGEAPPGDTGYTGPGNSPNSGQSMNNILQGLAGLYMGNKYIKNMNSQYNTLSGMYGQDSPYAQTLRQRLDRRDAAAGRRSQYGPREVELQAALAGQYGQNAPMMQGLNSNITQARMQQLMMLNKMLGGRRGMDSIYGSLQSLFGGGSPNDWFKGGQGLDASLSDWGSGAGVMGDWTSGGKGLEATLGDWGG